MQEEIKVGFFLCQVRQPRLHINGADGRILPVFCRADLITEITAGAILRGDLKDIIHPFHIAGFNRQTLQCIRCTAEIRGIGHFGADSRMRTGRDTIVALGTERRFPDGDHLRDIAFFPAGGAGRPGAVRRECRYRQSITASGQHHRSDSFDKVRRVIRHNRRTRLTERIHCLQRHAAQGFRGAGYRHQVILNDTFPFFAVAADDRLL